MWSLGKLDPVHCPIGSVLAFLQKCFFAGVDSATLRVYVAAIAAEHVPLQGVSIRDILFVFLLYTWTKVAKAFPFYGEQNAEDTPQSFFCFLHWKLVG